MKFLFLSNFYPPHHLGGYELLCEEVASQLAQRGHRVEVLTSTFGASAVTGEIGVHRRLRLQSDIHYYRPQQVLRYQPDRRANVKAVREVLAAVQPDVAVVWGMWNLSWSVAAEVEAVMGPRVAYYLNNTWPIDPSPHEAYWRGTSRRKSGQLLLSSLRGPAELMLRGEWLPCQLRLEHVAVCSQATKEQLRQAGLRTDHYRVIYHGIDAAAYHEAAARQAAAKEPALRVVFVGSLLPHKGVHTAVEALAVLVQMHPSTPVTLDILGAGHPDYEQRLHGMVSDLGLADRVTFHTPIPRQQLPAFLAAYDVLVLPSIWEEPMALISEEAMAAGLVLVGTLTGGTKEILSDGVNGLAFGCENPEELAGQLLRLAYDVPLRKRLADAAWQTIQEGFTTERMMDHLELFFAEMAAETAGRALVA